MKVVLLGASKKGTAYLSMTIQMAEKKPLILIESQDVLWTFP